MVNGLALWLDSEIIKEVDIIIMPYVRGPDHGKLHSW